MSYLKYRWKVFGVFALFVLVFATVFFLYHVPLYAAGYACLICAFLGTLFLLWDARCFYVRHRRLQQLMEEIKVSVDHLPVPVNSLESDYQELVHTVFTEKQAIVLASDNRYDDLVEYYTLWAHQIKTPIAAMRLLLQHEDTPLAMELTTELQRIEQYVEMVLCYLRLDSNSTDYVIRKYDLDDIVRQAVRKYAAQFVGKKIKLEYAPLDCQVLTDEKWLLFVIEQILSNALKYTASGSISICMEPNRTLCIRDTGIGIAPEDLPRIWEKGFTGYNGRRDKRASGIGLYLSRRILRNLSHEIAITSELGVGTTVRILLDCRKLEVEQLTKV